MAYLLSQSIAWAQSVLTSYIPLTAQTGNEPATTIANVVVNFMLSPPFVWPTNRAEDASQVTSPGNQDYTVAIPTFGFLESATLTLISSGKSWAVPNVYNTSNLGTSNEQTARPNSICIRFITPGTGIVIRFLSAPDASYRVNLTYQMAPVFFNALNQDWFTQCNIPQNQMHIYNNLFLSECFQVNGDEQAAAMYRRRGMASLLAMAEGLTEMQKNMIFGQAMYTDLQTIAANLRTQTAAQARTI